MLFVGLFHFHRGYHIRVSTKWWTFYKVFKCIFLKQNVCILIQIWLKFVPMGLIDNNSMLAKVKAWCQIPKNFSYHTGIYGSTKHWADVTYVLSHLIWLLYCLFKRLSKLTTNQWSSTLLAFYARYPPVTMDSPSPITCWQASRAFRPDPFRW